MAITYELKRQIQEKWGIDVTVMFTSDNGKQAVRTFRFDDQDQIDAEFDARMAKAISNYEDDREREITPQEIVDKLKQYFQSNTNLTRAQALAWLDDKVLVDGAL